MSSRDAILNKLRAARRPFEDAEPRPKTYLPVVPGYDESPDGLLQRFTTELLNLKGEVFVVSGEDAARECAIERLREHNTKLIIAWDFTHIPVDGLKEAISGAGIQVLHPDTYDEYRADILAVAETAQVGLTSAEAAIAATGTLIVRTAKGRGRIPTVLAPVHLVVIHRDQILPRLEAWMAQQRGRGFDDLAKQHANVCFISGPSRTGDIEMELILGVHGPGRVQVIVKT
jgi:L-lactate dehydrogenase complex protein LldG